MTFAPRIVPSLLVVIAAILDVTIVQRIEIADASPDVLMLTVSAVALLGGSIAGAWYGFLGGMVIALAMGLPLGTHAMVAAIIGYWVGRWGEVLVTDEHPAPPLIAGVLAAGTMQVGYPLVAFLVDPNVHDTSTIWPESLLVASLSAPLAIPVYLACRKIIALVDAPDAQSGEKAGGEA